MQSEHFRSFLTNPESMRQMTEMMRGAGGSGGGGFPPPGAFGFGSGAPGATAAPAPAGNLFNPWANAPNIGAQPPAAGAFNPFATGAGGATGGPDYAQLMANLQAMGGLGGLGGFGGAPAAPTGPVVSPEERYAVRIFLSYPSGLLAGGVDNNFFSPF